jgi:aromatic-amino-acid transaminase
MSEFNPPEPSPDPLLDLIGRYRADTRPHKIDVGVGVYRNDQGDTPVLEAVKTAETLLLQQQQSKSYLGLTGDTEFVQLVGELIFASQDVALVPELTATALHVGDKWISGAQTPGGSGALRVASELFKATRPDATLWVGTPTWPNHIPLTEAAGLKTQCYEAFDKATQTILFEATLDAIASAASGDGVLIHGCCHNPTGADLSLEQVQTLCELMNDKDLLPMVDLAYHGLGAGLLNDLHVTREIVSRCPHTLVAASCSKNFGLYRDRVGAVFMATGERQRADHAQAYFGHIARRIYSMPPDHGAASVRLILSDATLRKQWLDELDTMVERIQGLRKAIAKQQPGLQFVSQQRGMFSLLPLSAQQCDTLINDHAVYLAGDGRINIAGCQLGQVEQFCAALSAVGLSAVGSSAG